MFDMDFAEFWAQFPRKVGKLAARKEYDKVRRAGVTQEAILDGITLYVETKPSYADFCHPRTWLAQGRWMDEAPISPARVYEPWVCPHEPHCKHRPACDFLSMRKRA